MERGGIPTSRGIRFRALHFAALAKTAERGKFDALFLQDLVGVRESLGREAMRHGHHGVVQLDPWLVLASNAAATSRIGLVATSPTTYNQVAGRRLNCAARGSVGSSSQSTPNG